MRTSGPIDQKELKTIFEFVKQEHLSDWLLPLEIYELVCSTRR